MVYVVALSIWRRLAVDVCAGGSARSSEGEASLRGREATMSNEVLMVVFTGVIAVATAIYSFFAIQLWRATRDSVGVSRDLFRLTSFSAFFDLLMRMEADIQSAALRGRSEADVTALRRYRDMLAELGFGALVRNVDIAENPEAREYVARFAGFFTAMGVDPASVPGLGAMLKQLDN